MSVYEVHLGSWRRAPGNRMLTYLELAEQLVDYVADMGFTHIELMPVSEYPFDGSWGYQPVGLFAPTIRHGTPQEFAPSSSGAPRGPWRAAGLGAGAFPDRSAWSGPLRRHRALRTPGPARGLPSGLEHAIYNYGRVEVSNYLVSNALYWLEGYHLDGLRVDAVASMLYRDYSRKGGEWVPNKRRRARELRGDRVAAADERPRYGDIRASLTVAEESTAFPGVSRPVEAGGLGFGFKWNMGWMNDTLGYMHEGSGPSANITTTR